MRDQSLAQYICIVSGIAVVAGIHALPFFRGMLAHLSTCGSVINASRGGSGAGANAESFPGYNRYQQAVFDDCVLQACFHSLKLGVAPASLNSPTQTAIWLQPATFISVLIGFQWHHYPDDQQACQPVGPAGHTWAPPSEKRLLAHQTRMPPDIADATRSSRRGGSQHARCQFGSWRCTGSRASPLGHSPPALLLADIDPASAWSLLTELTQKELRGLAQPLLDSPAKRQQLRDALLIAASNSYPELGWVHDADPEVLLGIMASDIRVAVRCLRDYCQALGLSFLLPTSRVPGVTAIPAIQGPVFVKYNSRTGLCYASLYEGRDRGVLISLGQAPQVGHLPLGLHDEGLKRPPPAL